jgi:hypothetical protein
MKWQNRFFQTALYFEIYDPDWHVLRATGASKNDSCPKEILTRLSAGARNTYVHRNGSHWARTRPVCDLLVRRQHRTDRDGQSQCLPIYTRLERSSRHSSSLPLTTCQLLRVLDRIMCVCVFAEPRHIRFDWQLYLWHSKARHNRSALLGGLLKWKVLSTIIIVIRVA